MPQAFLIDGTAFCYRAFYAIRVLSASDGRPTNAVYGFAMMLGALRKAKQPEYLAVAFDAGKPTFRHERFPDYKIQRKPMPDPLIAQLPLIKELLAAYRIPAFQLEGYEAEDLLATLARRIAQACDVFLVTGDKDALQLVGPRIKVYNPHKDHVVLDAGAVQERYGVPPERMVDLMALMGDAIDNIPGVPGIGEKTASELLRQFGSVEGLYEHLDDLKSASQRTTLAQHREQVELARELARIDDRVPIEVQLSDLAVREPDWTALRRLFRMLEFKRLLADLDVEMPAQAGAPVQAHVVQEASAFARLEPWLASTSPAAVWSHHDETSDARLLALAWNATEAWIIPLPAAVPQSGTRRLHSRRVAFGDAAGRGIIPVDDAKPAAFLEPLWAWFASSQRPKVAHDWKPMIRWLLRIDKSIQGITDDTMIGAYLLNPARSSPTLQDTTEDWLELRLGSSASEAIAGHACAILPLAKRLREELRRAQLERLYEDLELPLVHVLADMESAGVAIDRELLASLRAQMQAKLHTLSEEICRLAGTEFNLNSPKQLAEVLFGRLKLPVVKRTKTGPSTDSEVLHQLADQHPLPQKLIEYRELTKLVSTYLDALPQLLDPTTHRLHSSFNQAGTSTGRLSSSDPNLQNIPIKTELGRQIRKAFIPGESGWVLVAADYSQIELRILAHLSNDPALIHVFQQDRDVHRHTASLIYGVPEEDVTPEMRSAMKAVNFGIIYGMSAHGLSKELGIPHEEAAAFIDAYFARYARVRACLDEHIHRARQDGYVQTLLSRRRFIPEVNSPDPIVRQFGERMAVNTPIQGTAADLIKLAMVRLAEAFRRRHLASRMILQVHDELVFEVPPKEQDTVVALVRDVMEHAVELIVPLRVVVKTGPNWLDMHETRDSRLETRGNEL